MSAELDTLLGLPVGSWEPADLLTVREILGFTQAELAAAIDYDRSAIAKIEAGDARPRRVVELAIRYLVVSSPKGTPFKTQDFEKSQFGLPGEPLGVNEARFPGGEDVKVYLKTGPAIWLRVMPALDTGWRGSQVELKRAATQNGFPLIQLINGYSNLGFVRSAEGFGAYGIIDRNDLTTSISFLFKTGEIWAIDTYLLEGVKQHIEKNNQMRAGIPYIEDRFKLALHSFRILLRGLGFSSKLQWVAGIEGIYGMGLYYPARPGHYFPIPDPHGNAIEDRVYCRGEIAETETPASALAPFFEKLFDVCGMERPAHLDNVSNPK